jgi:hypothetical protein
MEKIVSYFWVEVVLEKVLWEMQWHLGNNVSKMNRLKLRQIEDRSLIKQ